MTGLVEFLVFYNVLQAQTGGATPKSVQFVVFYSVPSQSRLCRLIERYRTQGIPLVPRWSQLSALVERYRTLGIPLVPE